VTYSAAHPALRLHRAPFAEWIAPHEAEENDLPDHTIGACYTDNGMELECVREIRDERLHLAHRNFGNRDSIISHSIISHIDRRGG